MYQQVFENHADLLKAMAHPRRLEIVHLLREQELRVMDLEKMLGLPQANLSQHLKILRDSGVVKDTRNGKEIVYSLSDERFVLASDLVREILVERSKGDRKVSLQLKEKMLSLMPLVKDPVCGMRVSPKTAGGHYEHEGKTYYFCAQGCEKKFKNNIEGYIK